MPAVAGASWLKTMVFTFFIWMIAKSISGHRSETRQSMVFHEGFRPSTLAITVKTPLRVFLVLRTWTPKNLCRCSFWFHSRITKKGVSCKKTPPYMPEDGGLKGKPCRLATRNSHITHPYVAWSKDCSGLGMAPPGPGKDP